MKIAGYQGISLIDFPGRICSVLFTPGCNFACPFCQNPELVHPPDQLQILSPEAIDDLLVSRKGFIDGVTITGGEPTILPGLPDFLRKLKAMGYPVKLDTNGYLPDVLEALIREGLLEFVAMDIKTSLDRYDEAAGRKVETDRIERSIDLLMNSDIHYEFRTTVVPRFVNHEDVIRIARRISGAKSYRLHQFSNRITLDPGLAKVKPYLPEVLKQMAEAAMEYVEDVKTRGI